MKSIILGLLNTLLFFCGVQNLSGLESAIAAQQRLALQGHLAQLEISIGSPLP